MSKIFVSYRREDSQNITGRITDHLAERFGSDHFFKDVDSIPLGEDFRSVIADALGDCSLLLAIIGPDWMAQDSNGHRRIDDPNDYVRSELRSAIESNIPVIPVLVDNCRMPDAESLPEDLRAISFKNAVLIRPDPDFRNDVDRLANHLAQRLNLVPAGAFRRRTIVAGVVTMLLILFVVVASNFFVGKPRNVPVTPIATRPKLRIGLKQWVGYTPLAVARELGLIPPGIEVDFRNVESVEEMNTKLVNGEIDIALIGQEGVTATKDFHSAKLCSLRVCACGTC